MVNPQYDPLHLAQVEMNKIRNAVMQLSADLEAAQQRVHEIQARKTALETVAHILEKGLAAMTEGR